jgi:octaprenyl-diphosphate synthase
MIGKPFSLKTIRADPFPLSPPVGSLAFIQSELDEVDAWIEACLKEADPDFQNFLHTHPLHGGKKIRAAFLLMAGKACGGIQDEHVPVAGILEMVHAATLVHDDILDEAEARRGSPCVHSRWGTQAAVLLGDWIYSKAFLESTRLSNPACSRVLAEATLATCRGEIVQDLLRGDFLLSMERCLQATAGKTASLFQCAGILGAEYSNSGRDLGKGLADFGWNAGLAFQIQDDLLDMTGDPGGTGKTLGTDWMSGKMTYPLILIRENLEKDERSRMGEMFNSSSSVRDVSQAFPEAWTEALQWTRTEIDRLLACAIAALAPLEGRPGIHEMKALALWTARRKA